MKVALYCPQFHQEPEDVWNQRWNACRNYVREHSSLDVIRFDSLDELIMRYNPRAFRRVVVAHQGYYKPDFHEWVCRNRIPVLDVMSLSN